MGISSALATARPHQVPAGEALEEAAAAAPSDADSAAASAVDGEWRPSGLLPGIGGTFTRFGHVEVLYVTELAGLLLIYLGYRLNIAPVPAEAVAPLPAG